MKRWGLFAVVVAMFVAMLPLAVAATSNSDIIAILTTGIDGVVKLTKLAYCASGIGALC